MSEYNHRECEETSESDAFATHMNAMTTEKLHSKAEIALELAARDNHITELKALLSEGRDLVFQARFGIDTADPWQGRSSEWMRKAREALLEDK